MNFTDLQVLNLIKMHPGANIKQLTRIAHDEMPKWPWTVTKIQRAANRLQAAGKIKAEVGSVAVEVPCIRLYGVENGR